MQCAWYSAGSGRMTTPVEDKFAHELPQWLLTVFSTWQFCEIHSKRAFSYVNMYPFRTVQLKKRHETWMTAWRPAHWFCSHQGTSGCPILVSIGLWKLDNDAIEKFKILMSFGSVRRERERFSQCKISRRVSFLGCSGKGLYWQKDMFTTYFRKM